MGMGGLAKRAAPVESMGTTYDEAGHPRQANGRWEEKRQTDQGDGVLNDPFQDDTLDDLDDTTIDGMDAERWCDENGQVACPICGGGGRLVDDSTCRTCHGTGQTYQSVINRLGIAQEGQRPMTVDDLDWQSDPSARNLMAVKLLADDLHERFPQATAFDLLQTGPKGETRLGTVWDSGLPMPPPARPVKAVDSVRGVAGLDNGLASSIDDMADIVWPDTRRVRINMDDARQIGWDHIWAGAYYTPPFSDPARTDHPRQTSGRREEKRQTDQGEGEQAPTRIRPCPWCDGAGKKVAYADDGSLSLADGQTCAACGGAGVIAD